MSNFKVHTKNTAPRASSELLAKAEGKYGFVPNLMGVMAESAPTLKAYQTLGGLFDQSSLSPSEKQVAILAISRYNRCQYCVAAHSTIAGMQKVPEDAVQAIRNDQPIPDARLEALRRFATQVVEKRGWVSEEELNEFLNAGYTRAQVLEVILAASFKTLSNYINHLADTPLDGAFSNRRWEVAA